MLNRFVPKKSCWKTWPFHHDNSDRNTYCSCACKTTPSTYTSKNGHADVLPWTLDRSQAKCWGGRFGCMNSWAIQAHDSLRSCTLFQIRSLVGEALAGDFEYLHKPPYSEFYLFCCCSFRNRKSLALHSFASNRNSNSSPQQLVLLLLLLPTTTTTTTTTMQHPKNFNQKSSASKWFTSRRWAPSATSEFTTWGHHKTMAHG